MKLVRNTNFLIFLILLMAHFSLGYIQRYTVQAAGNAWPDDWQGEKPAPQSDSPSPGPQRTTPSGKQVMEIPSRPQSPSELPRQQAEIPRRPQPEERRPDQLITVTVTEPQGRYVAGLQPEDFEVYEDGQRRQITNFSYVSPDPSVTVATPVAPITPANRNAPPPPPLRLRPGQVMAGEMA